MLTNACKNVVDGFREEVTVVAYFADVPGTEGTNVQSCSP